jgi:hypothetical protein
MFAFCCYLTAVTGNTNYRRSVSGNQQIFVTVRYSDVEHLTAVSTTQNQQKHKNKTRMSLDGMYDNFRQFCWQPPNIQPYLWGMPALVTFDHNNYQYPLGMIVVAIVCCILAVRTLYVTRRPWSGMSITIAAYCVGTAMFGFARAASDFSRILLLGAASHNAPEWSIIVHMLAEKSEILKRWKRTQYWMWFVCVVTIYTPSIFIAAVFEQTAGIVCDYMLLFLFWMRYIYALRKSSDDPNREAEVALWRKGAIGSLLHFGQIWALVFGQGFPIIGTPALLFHVSVALSAIPTFYVYSDFAIAWDEAEAKYEQQQEGVEERGTEHEPQPAFTPYLSQTAHKAKWVILLLLSIGWATFTIPGVPKLVGFCNEPHTSSSLTNYPKLIDYTIIQPKLQSDKAAIKSLLEESITEARQQGVAYDLMESPDHFALLKYESKNGGNSDTVQQTLTTSYFTNIAQIGHSDFHPVSTASASKDVHLAFRVEIANSDTNALWKVLSNWKDASYIKGCNLIEVTKKTRRCTFQHGGYDHKQELVHIDNEKKTIVWKVVDGFPADNVIVKTYLASDNGNTILHQNVDFSKRSDAVSNGFEDSLRSNTQENLNWIQTKYSNTRHSTKGKKHVTINEAGEQSY